MANKLVREESDGRAEFILVSAPDQRVDSICTDNEIGVLNLIERADRALELHGNSDRLNPLLQQLKELKPPTAEKPIPSIRHHAALQVELDVDQDSIAGVIAAYVSGSSSRRNSRARSENTTPNPNVAPAVFCSKTHTSAKRPRRLSR
jgi:hypothetical protein